MDGIELTFDDAALNEIAKLAIERNTGARGLRSIIENVMMKPMFEIPSMQGVKKVTVTKEFVTGKGDLLIETEIPEQINENTEAANT
jgi:ATP-dependent Clp protease ATP-binding subunit ClpX